MNKADVFPDIIEVVTYLVTFFKRGGKWIVVGPETQDEGCFCDMSKTTGKQVVFRANCPKIAQDFDFERFMVYICRSALKKTADWRFFYYFSVLCE